eukprot:scaffold116254_cov16-Tisochrysis_lutea.AAC.2
MLSMCCYQACAGTRHWYSKGKPWLEGGAAVAFPGCLLLWFAVMLAAVCLCRTCVVLVAVIPLLFEIKESQGLTRQNHRQLHTHIDLQLLHLLLCRVERRLCQPQCCVVTCVRDGQCMRSLRMVVP